MAADRAKVPAVARAADRVVAAGVAESQRTLVYGLHAIQGVLKTTPERLLELWVAQARDDDRIRDLSQTAAEAGAHVHSVSAAVLEKMVGGVVHQGAVAAIRPLKPWDEDDLLKGIVGFGVSPLLLVLDGITDPHNLGACLRSADAAGVNAVIIPKDRVATVDAVVRKVAAGAAEYVPVASVTNLARTLDALKERNIWVAGLDGEAQQSLYGADLNRPLALVLGAEGSGMRRLTREKCDFLVHIPMIGQVESLNVSVAAGVSLFEVRRQRIS
jgi:23S rRNA (guanosine2251-2'-O)-methyltransferase